MISNDSFISFILVIGFRRTNIDYVKLELKLTIKFVGSFGV